MSILRPGYQDLPSFKRNYSNPPYTENKSGGKKMLTIPSNRGPYQRPLPTRINHHNPALFSQNYLIFNEYLSSNPLPLSLSQRNEIALGYDSDTKKLAASLLKYPYFTAEPNKDLDFESQKNLKKIRAQKKEMFFKTVMLITEKNHFVLSPNYLRAGQEYAERILDLDDKNMHLLIKYKKLSQVFNLKGEITLPNEVLFDLEGGRNQLQFPALRAAFDQFAYIRKDLISDQTLISITKSLSNADYDSYIKDEKIAEIHKNIHDCCYCDSIIVVSGDANHSIKIIFFKKPSGGNYLLYCNRGRGSKGQPGIQVLKLDKTSKITKQFIKSLSERRKLPKGNCITVDELNEILGSKTICYIPMAPQKVGNCVYSSYKAVFYALFLVRIFKENPWIEDFNFPELEKKWAKQVYKEFSRFDAVTVLEDLLIDLRKDVPLQFLSNADEIYWYELLHIAMLLKNKLLYYSDAIKLGKETKIPSELVQNAIALIEQFEHQMKPHRTDEP